MISASRLFGHMAILEVNALQLSPVGCFVLLTKLSKYTNNYRNTDLVRFRSINILPDYLAAVMIHLELMFFVAIVMPHQNT